MYQFKPLNISHLKRYKILCAQDFINDPSWTFATILILTNYERKLFEFEQARCFAIKHKHCCSTLEIS
jgi:hypothetical protein